MKIPIPFTKDKILNISLKGASNFITLRDQDVSQLVGFDGFIKPKQNEQKLLDDGYGSNVTVFAIIKRIADAGADIPKVLVTEEDPTNPITEGEVFDMFQTPGVMQGEVLTQFDYFEALITYLLGSGNTYQHILKAIGFGELPQRMEILPSGLMAPLQNRSFRTPVLGYKFTDKSQTVPFGAEEIMHTKYVNPTRQGLSSLEGLSPLQAALFSMTGSNDIQKAISIMVKHQGARGILTNKSERLQDPEELEVLTSKVNENVLGVKNFNKIHATGEDMDYLQIGMSSNDLKIIESGVLTDRQLCNAYGVSSRLFNDPANSTFNNVKEANKAMYQNAVLPTLNKILEDINRFWLGPWSEQDGVTYKLTLDLSKVDALQADQKTEAEKDKLKMEGVDKILRMPISREAKSSLLQTDYGFSEEIANEIVAPQGGVNDTLEKLKSLSPLLANKLVDKLPEDVVSGLLD